MTNPDLEQYRDAYFSEIAELLGSYAQLLVEFEQHPESQTRLQELFRLAHTMKGMSAMMGFQAVADFVHEWEDLFDALRQGRVRVTSTMVSALLGCADVFKRGIDRLKARQVVGAGEFAAALASLTSARTSGAEAPAPSAPAVSTAAPASTETPIVPATLRVDVAVLDELLNLTGELTIVKTRLQQLSPSFKDESLERTIHQAHRIVTRLQDRVLATRVVPVRDVFNRFPRLVRDLSQGQAKEVELVIEGSEVGMDRAILEGLAEPLTHIVNNAVTHGIERMEVRTAGHKPAKGRVTVAARREPGSVVIEVRDDGAGMDPDRLRQQAVRMGQLTPDQAARLSNREALMLSTLPGLSTAASVTTSAGRGVGMDVVRDRIQRMQGTLMIDSVKGVGSTITLRLPFTLTLLQALLVKTGSQVFSLPFLSVKELLPLPPGNPVEVLVGEDTVPVRSLSSLLRMPPMAANGGGKAVLLESGNRRVVLAVDALLTQQEIVVKPLPQPLAGLSPFAGATILGDGTVSLILDPHALMRLTEAGAPGSSIPGAGA